MESFVTYLVLALFISGIANLVLGQKYRDCKRLQELMKANRIRPSRGRPGRGSEPEEGG